MRKPQVRYKQGAWRAVFYAARLNGDSVRYAEKWVTLTDPWGNRITDEKASAAAGKALRRLERERRLEEDSRSRAGASLSVADAVESYLGVRSGGITRGTLGTYRASLRRFVVSMGRLPVSLITSREIEVYQSELLAAGINPLTTGNYLDVLSSLFRWLEDARLLPRGSNPVTPVRRARVPEKTRPYLRWADAGPLLAAVAHPPYRAAVALALFAGLRRGEAVKLRWENIDFESGVISVRNTSRWVTKSGRERETILLPELRAVLRDVRRQGPFVVYHTRTVTGAAAQGQAIGRAFAEARLAVGMPDLRFHDLRGSFATELLQRFPPAVVQQLMGHADVQTTMKYYSRINPARAVEIVKNELFRNL